LLGIGHYLWLSFVSVEYQGGYSGELLYVNHPGFLPVYPYNTAPYGNATKTFVRGRREQCRNTLFGRPIIGVGLSLLVVDIMLYKEYYLMGILSMKTRIELHVRRNFNE